ncbi:hypothetical protein VTL71DRAFT_1456 [Oculimacula yallundae]|uniref:Uncharacterized protein n=1 Tax=Oculimacula yallundae TaxID=86028 RepID=A0ABR4CBJ6_9HELO
MRGVGIGRLCNITRTHFTNTARTHPRTRFGLNDGMDGMGWLYDSPFFPFFFGYTIYWLDGWMELNLLFLLDGTGFTKG